MQAMPMQPGQGPPGRPSPEQIQAIQRKIAEDAEKAGMSVPDYVNKLRQQAAMQMQMQQQQQGGQPGPDGQPQGQGPPPQMTPEQLQQAQQRMQQQLAQMTPEQRAQFQAQQQQAMQQRLAQMTPEQRAQFQAQQQAAMQQQLAQMTPEQRAQVQAAQQQAMQQQQAQQQQQQQQPITPGPPNPTGLAMANFLRSQELKLRTVIFNGERKDMFRVKRALRAIESPAYEKARKKNPDLPVVTDRASLENAFKLLPLSMLALRVRKVEDEHEGHNHGPATDAEKKKKRNRIKGQWNVAIERQQDAGDDMYYIWLYEGSQVMRKVYAGLAVLAIFLGVLYPLWPLKMRLGVYYLSYGFLGLLCLFFAMAIFRLILFVITYYTVSPGLWLYPNLWEDVSFMDSFRPVWAWHDPNPKKKKKAKKTSVAAAQSQFANSTGQPTPASANTTAVDTKMQVPVPTQRVKTPQIEEVADDEE